MKKGTGRKNYNARMVRCCQDEEMHDCFARNVRGNCAALRNTDYPCGRCPFYKQAAVHAKGQQMVYARLVRLERMDLIMKYSVPDLREG